VKVVGSPISLLFKGTQKNLEFEQAISARNLTCDTHFGHGLNIHIYIPVTTTWRTHNKIEIGFLLTFIQYHKMQFSSPPNHLLCK